MPKETFLKLPEEKKNKIIKAAKKEFERVPFEQTSIKNIVEDADIARGRCRYCKRKFLSIFW